MGYLMSLSRYLDPYPVLFHGVSTLCLNNSLTHFIGELEWHGAPPASRLAHE